MTTNAELPHFRKRNAISFHASPTDGGSTLGAFAHKLCGHNHLRTMDCECQGCHEAFDALLPVAAALEAAEAQVARMRAIVAGAGTPEEMNTASVLFARIDSENVPYPADLLAAVQTVEEIGGRGWDTLTGEEYEKQTAEWNAAIATLRRYGLLGEAR